MLLVWTQTVPRRLIDSRTGRDVTASVPLIYPYIDVVTQSRELGRVTIVQRNGQVAKRIVRNPVLSSRSAPKVEHAKPAPRILNGKRYVQIGTFGKATNAQKSAQNIAQMGYHARIGKHRKGGKSYLTVQAGPFNDANSLQSAIARLRGAGYADAFARN
jgi:cell division protein FtsN